jgi:hypothetical protein
MFCTRITVSIEGVNCSSLRSVPWPPAVFLLPWPGSRVRQASKAAWTFGRTHTSPAVEEQSQLGAQMIVRSRKRLAQSSNFEIDTWHKIQSRLLCTSRQPPGHLDELERDSGARSVTGGLPVIVGPYAAPRINRCLAGSSPGPGFLRPCA